MVEMRGLGECERSLFYVCWRRKSWFVSAKMAREVGSNLNFEVGSDIPVQNQLWDFLLWQFTHNLPDFERRSHGLDK